MSVNFKWRVVRWPTCHLKFTFMWPWQITLWIRKRNMHVHCSNRVKNTGISREGPSPRGAPSVPPFSTSFPWGTARTKDRQGVDEGWGGRNPGSLPPQPSSTPWRSLVRAVSREKLVENLRLKIPYKFKNSYGGTSEPRTPQDAPWLHGPSLKNERDPYCIY